MIIDFRKKHCPIVLLATLFASSSFLFFRVAARNRFGAAGPLSVPSPLCFLSFWFISRNPGFTLNLATCSICNVRFPFFAGEARRERTFAFSKQCDIDAWWLTRNLRCTITQ